MTSMLDIYRYLSYRAYLRDFYRERKRSNSSYSYRVFAAKAQLSSANYLKLVIDGKRPITSRTLPQFVRGLSLDRASAGYFKALVIAEHSTDSETRLEHLRKIDDLRRKSAQLLRALRADQLEVAQTWYHWTLREMVLLDDFKPDPDWISARLRRRISPAQADESLKLLERTGCIRMRDGRYEQSETLLVSPDETPSATIREMHRQFLKLGDASLIEDALEQREVGSVTLALCPERLARFKGLIKKFRRDMNREFSRSTGNTDVYHFQLLLFPLTRTKETRP